MGQLYLISVMFHLFIILKHYLFGVLCVERIILEVRTIKDFEELLVNLDV